MALAVIANISNNEVDKMTYITKVKRSYLAFAFKSIKEEA